MLYVMQELLFINLKEVDSKQVNALLDKLVKVADKKKYKPSKKRPLEQRTARSAPWGRIHLRASLLKPQQRAYPLQSLWVCPANLFLI